MLFLLILALCYSVSSFDVANNKINLQDGNLEGVLDKFKMLNNEEDIAEKMAMFRENMKRIKGRMAEMTSKTDTAAPKSTPINRFCQRIEYMENCYDDSDLPESFIWPQLTAMPANPDNNTQDYVASVLSQYTAYLQRFMISSSPLKLAAEQLTDCAEEWEKQLSWMGSVSRLLIQGGFELESVYNSTNSDSKCRFEEDKVAVHVPACYQFNFETEICMKRAIKEYGPMVVGLRNAHWNMHSHNSFGPITDCDAVVEEYVPFIVIGYAKEQIDDHLVDVWYVRNPEGVYPRILAGAACQDIGLYPLFFVTSSQLRKVLDVI